MNRPNELIKELEEFNADLYGNELSTKECHLIADYIKSLEKEIKQLIDEVDYYKHEYYSECDLREALEKALDKACEQLENLSYVKGLGQIDRNFKEWKEWCMKDE